MTEENDKTQEQARAQAPAQEPVEPAKTFTVKQPEQKTINVVGGVVIATLVAIVLAQAIGDNNELSSSQMRGPAGGANGQFQGPPGMQGQQGPGMQGPDMQAPGMQGPGMNGQGGQAGPGWNQDQEDSDRSDDDRSDDTEKNDDRGGTSQNNVQPTPNSRAS